jgi:hypothetical protein
MTTFDACLLADATATWSNNKCSETTDFIVLRWENSGAACRSCQGSQCQRLMPWWD